MSECPTKNTRKFFSVFSFLASAAKAPLGSVPSEVLPASNVNPSRTVEASPITFNERTHYPRNILNNLDNIIVRSFNQQQPSSSLGLSLQEINKYTTLVSNQDILNNETNDNSQVVCLNWSDDLENQGHTDELNLTIGLKEYGEFVMYEAYN